MISKTKALESAQKELNRWADYAPDDERLARVLGEIASALNEEAASNARLVAASPELLQSCRCALADLEGIMLKFEPSGDKGHPAWTTIAELKHAIRKTEIK